MKYACLDRELGVCVRRRVLDIGPWKKWMQAHGHHETHDFSDADKVFAFTCGFNQPQQSLCLQFIRGAVEQYGAALVVAGCMPSICPGLVRDVFSGKTFPNETLRLQRLWVGGGKDIPIGNGCMGLCSYCADRIAVGALCSRSMEDCLKDLQTGLDAGLESFRLVADDLGAWGQDLGSDFTQLLSALVVRGNPLRSREYRLQLLEINAGWLVQYASNLEVFRSPCFDSILVGIQSANDRVLSLMRRGYGIDDASTVLGALKSMGKRIGGHFLVGFPTETDAEFGESLAFIPDAGLDFGFIFLYSDMPGTPSFFLQPKVEDGLNRLSRAAAFLRSRGYRVREEAIHKISFSR